MATVNEKLTAVADAIRAKTGGSDPLTLDQMASAIAGIETGGGGTINTGTCTIEIMPPSSSNYYVARETISADGSVSYVMTRNYTANKITVTARCDSVIYIMATTIKSVEVTAGQVLQVTSGYGTAYKTPDTNGVTAQVTLLS